MILIALDNINNMTETNTTEEYTDTIITKDNGDGTETVTAQRVFQ